MTDNDRSGNRWEPAHDGGDATAPVGQAPDHAAPPPPVTSDEPAGAEPAGVVPPSSRLERLRQWRPRGTGAVAGAAAAAALVVGGVGGYALAGGHDDHGDRLDRAQLDRAQLERGPSDHDGFGPGFGQGDRLGDRLGDDQHGDSGDSGDSGDPGDSGRPS